MDKWIDTTLGGILTLQRGFDLPVQDRGGGLYPVVASNGVVGLHDVYKVDPPGVVIGRSGSIGGGQFIDTPFWPLNTTLYVVDFKGNDPKFCYYLLRSIDFSGFNVGSGVPTLNRNHIHPLPVLCPPYGEQRCIGAVLGALDDKIDLNHRMNDTLESTVRALFKDWFVDFGPTRTKIDGGSPYLAAEIWSLFPESLDKDGKPKGWTFGTLGDVAKQVGESVKPEALDPGTPYIGLEHMPRKSIALSAWQRADKVTSGKLSFRKGDFLFGKLRPYFHKVGIAPVNGICSTDILALNARERKAAAFVLACISQDDFVAFTDRTSDGTKMPRTSWGRMERYGICIPNDSVLEAFDSLVQPLLDRIVANVHESRTLATTRDFLLPKLISGEVHVQPVEKLVGKAV